jgi:hypothetical protein
MWRSSNTVGGALTAADEHRVGLKVKKEQTKEGKKHEREDAYI